MLSEKIVRQRRRLNWSQEDLAARLDVSRQSVSKWESGASQPDADRIVAMSRLFGVTTDYLLKDEVEEADPWPEEGPVRGSEALVAMRPALEEEPEDADPTPVYRRNAAGERVLTPSEANRYLENRRQSALQIGIGATLCVACPAPLLALVGMGWQFYRLHPLMLGLGLAALFGMLAGAVYLFVLAGARLSKYRLFDREAFALTEAMAESAGVQREDFRRQFTHDMAMGAVLCAASPAPVVLLAFVGSGAGATFGSGILLAMIGAGVYLFVSRGIIMDSFARLLQEGRYDARRKRRRYPLDNAERRHQ